MCVVNVRKIMFLSAITALFLCLSYTATADSIYIGVATKKPQQIMGCVYPGPFGDQTLRSYLLEESKRKYRAKVESADAPDFVTNYRITDGPTVTVDTEAERCRGSIGAKSTTRSRMPSGNVVDVRDNTHSVHNVQSFYKEEDQCLEDGFRHLKGSDCYSEQGLADNDSCESSTLTENNHVSKSEDVACFTMDDGSMCPAKRNGSISSSTGSDTYFYHTDTTADPASCYSTTTTDDYAGASRQSQDTDTKCIGNYCPADIEKHTDQTGNLMPGCGQINGSTYCTRADIEEREQRNPDSTPIPPDNGSPDQPGPDEPGPDEPGPDEPITDTDMSGVIQAIQANGGKINETNLELRSLKQTNSTGFSNIDDNLTRANTKLDGIKAEVAAGTQAQKDSLGALNGIKTATEQLNETLNGPENLNNNTEPTADLTGFYEPEYENGMETLFERVMPILDQSEINQYLESWKITVAGNYAFPQFCVNVIVNLGCHSLDVDSRVIPFIRIILIVTSLMLARRLVFGG